MPQETVSSDAIFAKLFETRPRKGDLKKREIVEAAIRSLAREGVEETTFDSIGAELGVRRSHIAYYFKRKEDLIETAIQLITLTAQELTIQRLKKATTAREQIEAQVRAVFDWAEKFPDHVSVIALMYYYATFQEPYRRLNNQIRTAGRARLRGLIESMSTKRKLGDDEWEQLTGDIHSLVFGTMLFQAATQKRAPARAQANRVVQSVFRMIESAGLG